MCDTLPRDTKIAFCHCSTKALQKILATRRIGSFVRIPEGVNKIGSNFPDEGPPGVGVAGQVTFQSVHGCSGPDEDFTKSESLSRSQALSA